MRENPALAPIQDRLRQFSRLQQSFADALPPGLNQSCRVATVEGSTLVIAVANGAIATKLKQILPRLLEKIRENKKQEQEVTAITVIVQPDSFRPQVAGVAAPSRDPMPADKLAELTELLGDSPLKATMERIKTRRQRALTSGSKKR
ncbi:MAG: DUF721 domain-containing protein [Betaproteobacteria bacterium]|nr:DUF721 domain-containing protein [Betaproteobacteria bacterium]